MISDADWQTLFKARWFPFAGLRGQSIDELIGHLRAGWGVAELIPRFHEELMGKLEGFLTSWRTRAAFASHVSLLERAIERFRSADYESCTSILYPRIEGILRSHHILEGVPGKRDQL